jgi:beta-phosphoglucomutase
MTGALQAIIFDFDGVIADSERLHLLAYQQVLATHGLTLSDASYYERYLGYDDERLLRCYAKDHAVEWDEATFRQLIEDKSVRYDRLTETGEMIFPGAAQFVREVARRVPLAIASGALTHEIDEILGRAQLRSLFSAIVGADQTSRTKPSPEPYLEAFRRLATQDDTIAEWRTVAIEDSRWGLESARAAGLRPVAVTNTYAEHELSPYAELVVPGLDRLTIDVLDALCATPPLASSATSHEARRP